MFLALGSTSRSTRIALSIIRWRTLVTSAPQQERARVHVGNGTVDLDIHWPSHSPRPSRNTRAALLYLPRGPLLNNPRHDASNVDTLRATLPCPVIHVHYRYGAEHKYPVPVFDTAAAYDWVIQNMIDPSARPGRRRRGTVAVCGELLGGSLATTLALTECRNADAAPVAAVAVSNAILDWTELQTLREASDEPRQFQSSTLLTQQIRENANSLFRSMEDHFDPFASPILFFRSAGMKVPVRASRAGMDDMDELMQSERDELVRAGLASDSLQSVDDVVRRKSSKRFPSKAFDLRLPHFHISSGTESVLEDQTIEFRGLLVKAIERQERAKSAWSRGVGSRTQASTEDLVAGEKANGLGLWDDSAEGRASMLRTAQWLSRALDS